MSCKSLYRAHYQRLPLGMNMVLNNIMQSFIQIYANIEKQPLIHLVKGHISLHTKVLYWTREVHRVTPDQVIGMAFHKPHNIQWDQS